jgi:hypothetical protein
VAQQALDIPQRESFTPFPTAASVLLYVSEEEALSIDSNGRPSASTPDMDGIKLTSTEIKALQNAFEWTTPPDVIDACCIPRHAFAFYDQSSRYLGSIAVCFECGCARTNELRGTQNKDWLEWDRKAIAAIVNAHGYSADR